MTIRTTSMPSQTTSGMWSVDVLPDYPDRTVLANGWLDRREWDTIDAWVTKNVSGAIVKGVTLVAFETYDDALLFYMAFSGKR